MDLSFTLQLHNLCCLSTTHSLSLDLALQFLSRFFPSLSSYPHLSAYNYEAELYKTRCCVIPNENTVPRWLHIALETKTNDRFNTHSTSLASTVSPLSSTIPEGHRAIFWFFQHTSDTLQMMFSLPGMVFFALSQPLISRIQPHYFLSPRQICTQIIEAICHRLSGSKQYTFLLVQFSIAFNYTFI